MQHLLQNAERTNKLVAVLFLDLDNFKKVNDTLGHGEGDKLLVEIARRLKDAVRNKDTVGRLGGDEFVVLIDELTDTQEIVPIVSNLLKQFKSVFHLNGRDLLMTASMGIAFYPENGQDGAELLRNADTAMYRAKDQGRDNYCYYTESMKREVLRRFLLEEQLHGALARNEFYLCYQPLIAIKNQAFAGVEVLLRWNNAVLGHIGPDEFIPIAEQSGLIIPIGKYVLSQAFAWMTQWQSKLDDDFKLAINLSPRQLRDADFVPFMTNILKQSQIAGKNIELEITEGVLLNEHADINNTLTLIKQMGIGLAMDDFGTGYSSLSYLRSYPFNMLKIDRSFVRDITRDTNDRILVTAAIAMAHGLGIQVVAEGVETPEQLALLAGQQCDFAQGYYFSKPLIEKDIVIFIQQQCGS